MILYNNKLDLYSSDLEGGRPVFTFGLNIYKEQLTYQQRSPDFISTQTIMTNMSEFYVFTLRGWGLNARVNNYAKMDTDF